MTATTELEDLDVLATVFEVARIGICIITIDGRFSKVNPEFCRMVGYQESELIGQPYWMCAPPGIVAVHEKFLAAAIADSRKVPPEWQIRRRDGTLLDTLGSFRPVTRANGQCFIVVTFSDISERNAARQRIEQLNADLETRIRERTSALEVSERKYRRIIDATQEGFWLVDGWGRTVEVNQALCKMLGRSLDELKSAKAEDMFAEEYRDRIRAGMYPRPRIGFGRFELELLNRQGERIPVLINTVTHTDAAGDPEFSSAFFTDISRRKQLDRTLEQAVAERDAILNNSVVGIAFVRARSFVWTNKAFEQDMLGFEPGELSGKSSVVTYPSPELFAEWGPRINQILVENGVFQIEERVRRKDGTLIWCLVSGRMVDRADLSQGSIWTIVDISKRKAAEAELLESLAREKEASELKSRFVSMTSHEFRTPLAAIMSSTELLADYDDRLPAEEKTELINVIKSSVRRMTQMLEDILVIGKADAGRLDFRPEPVEIDALLAHIVHDVRRTTQTTHELRIDNRMAGRTPWLDPRLFAHVLQNLLINAIKYSPEGKPVSVTLEPTGNSVRITVADRGIGIPESDLAVLFISFHRGGNVGNIAGTGLGLAIVKKAVDLHRGSIDVHSALDQGSRFTVTLPDTRG